MNIKTFIAAVVITVTIGQTSDLYAASGDSKSLNVSKRAQTAIASNFPGATNLRWENEKPGIYIACFVQPNTRKIVDVDRHGNIISIVTYYTNGAAPEEVYALLAKEYPGKTIFGVTGIELKDGDEAGVYYQATLEDAAHWYTVMVSGDEARTTATLNK